jgi:glycosyltransferase involved in cell wall biosynthesis
LENLKRIDDALYALKFFKDYKKDFLFHIVGDGVEKNRLFKLANDLQLESNVVFHGYVSDTEKIEELYKKANIFLFPSISEGTPKVLAEAMSFGVIPIAVKTTGSIPYIIENRNNGFLVNKKSPEEIAEAIKELINNEILYKKMVENCYEYAKEHTLQKEVEKMWDFVFSKMELEK